MPNLTTECTIVILYTKVYIALSRALPCKMSDKFVLQSIYL